MATFKGAMQVQTFRYTQGAVVSKDLVFEAPAAGLTYFRWESFLILRNFNLSTNSIHLRQFNPITNAYDSGLDAQLGTVTGNTGSLYMNYKDVFNNAFATGAIAASGTVEAHNLESRVVDFGGIFYLTMFPQERILFTGSGVFAARLAYNVITQS